MTTPTLQVEVVEHREFPGTWVVEAIEFEHDGAIEQAVFSGPDARLRCEEYAAWKYQGAARQEG